MERTDFISFEAVADRESVDCVLRVASAFIGEDLSNDGISLKYIGGYPESYMLYKAGDQPMGTMTYEFGENDLDQEFRSGIVVTLLSNNDWSKYETTIKPSILSALNDIDYALELLKKSPDLNLNPEIKEKIRANAIKAMRNRKFAAD